jgi:hypothetical protein
MRRLQNLKRLNLRATKEQYLMTDPRKKSMHDYCTIAHTDTTTHSRLCPIRPVQSSLP